ncbi:MAG: aldo/keto reductase [Gemmatimonadota bacterium]|nr:aldo/keto reductase [Gemmatimonadota bacterium]MDH5196185.1 aldo/keto reductase [Gemmatimonadota bacterium]
MLSRREWIGVTAGAAGALALNPRLLRALQQGKLIQRAVPSTGEMLPVVGLGSSATFSQVARSEETDALTEVIRTMVSQGATVFDTAPSYGASEQVAGDIANTIGVADKIFWATKVNVVQRGGDGTADPTAARAQIDASFAKFRVPKIDLIQVHNLADVPTQLGILKQLKKEGRIRYLGVTTTSNRQYEQLDQVMRNEPLDFIGIDYAVDNRDVEETILPLAAERKIAVMVYVPFGRTRLWQRIEGQDLPPWAAEFDATTWAQFFIKYVLSHPAVTVVTPATSKANHMVDNIGGGMGRLPNAATRKRMAEFVDALPPAPPRNR